MPRKSLNKGKRQRMSSRTAETAAEKKRTGKPGKQVDSRKEKQLFDRLNTALEISKTGVWEWNVQKNQINWSDHLFKITGVSKKSFDGSFETFLNLVHPDDRIPVASSIQKIFSERNEELSLEFRIVWPDGSIHWIESGGNISYRKNGQPHKVLGTAREVTRRKIIEFEREDWKRRHEMVVNSAGLVIYDYNIATGHIIWSGNSADVLGYYPEELGNIDRWVSLIHPEDRDYAFNLLEIAEKDIKPYDVYYRFTKKSGDYCHIHDRGFFITDPTGKAVRMLGMMNDVSDRVNAEKAVRESNSFRESIENAIPDILYLFDLKHKQNIYSNKNLLGILGYTAEDFEKMGAEILNDVIHPDDIKKTNQWTDEKKGTVKEVEIRIKAKNGQYRWLATRNTPFKWDEYGRVTQIVGIAQDITGKKAFISRLNESEKSYRELFDSVAEAIFILRRNGRFLDVNKGAVSICGYEKSELINKRIDVLSAEGQNDFDAISASFASALNNRPQTFEFWGKRKNGDIILLEVKLTKGSYFGKDIIIATGWDITLRRRTEQALRDSEQRFRTLQQASFGGIGLHDKGVIIDCNQALCELTGYSYQELIGFNGLELIAPEWRPFVLEKILSGYEKTYDVEGIRKDGTRYFLEIHGKNVPFEGRSIRVTEFRDITERKKSEEKIVEQNATLQAVTEDLRRKNNQLEEFTQIVSHNLRSPAGNIVALLNFFDGTESEEEKKEYLKLLKESSATTLSMLNDLNEVLKIKQNKNIERKHLIFAEVLEEVRRMLNAKISGQSAVVESDFSAVGSIYYPGIYLESIFLNLLDNALKYAHPERTPVVRFESSINAEGEIILKVSDNGLGLDLQRYGHQVFKLRKTFHRHPESRGIGLFMIKNQIEAMGGDIFMESQENAGSTFFINFNKPQNDAN